MKHAILRPLLLSAICLALVTLAGCATMHPLSSKPPLSRIVLPAQFDNKAWAGLLPPLPYHVILPPGEYHPLYEDDHYYYYQAPSKLVVNDLSSSLFDGGVLVARGTTTPYGWYYIDVTQNGSINEGAFSTPLPAKLLP